MMSILPPKSESFLGGHQGRRLIFFFLIPAIIVAMLGGFCSPSEAGAAAVIYILIVEAIKGKFSFLHFEKMLSWGRIKLSAISLLLLQ